MHIREATYSDVPQILKVLKASLGETSSKKTLDVWQYKHVHNPFGKSLVLVAEENNEILGVRAFMSWKWQREGHVYLAYRAVDTATHPAHQGRGIFRKLTLKALEIGEEKGYHFVFNTPNSQSKPGYLKMGWEEVDKLDIHLRPLKLLHFKKKKFEYKIFGKEEYILGLLESYFHEKKETNKLFTPKDLEYLKWRYLNNPLQNYSIIFDKDFFIAGYIKDRGKFKEFRISEVISSKEGKRLVKSSVLNLAKSSGAAILSISPNDEISFKLGFTGGFGPVLTFRGMNCINSSFKRLDAWSYSLGDLELF